jgi:hypothetical protein
VYTATQLICIDSGAVGQAYAGVTPHQVCCCSAKCIGTLGIVALLLLTEPHTWPSIVYVMDVGVQITPQVCHCVKSVFS